MNGAQKNSLLGAIRILAITCWIVVMPLLFMLFRLLRVPGHKKMVPFFHAGTCWILGIKVSTSGAMTTERPALYVSNHISYIDIFVLTNTYDF